MFFLGGQGVFLRVRAQHMLRFVEDKGHPLLAHGSEVQHPLVLLHGLVSHPMQLSPRSNGVDQGLHPPYEVLVHESVGLPRVQVERLLGQVMNPVELGRVVPQELATGLGQDSQLLVGEEELLGVVLEGLDMLEWDEELVAVVPQDLLHSNKVSQGLANQGVHGVASRGQPGPDVVQGEHEVLDLSPLPLELGVGSVRRIWIAEVAQGEVGELAVADIMVVGVEDRDHTPQRRHVG